MRRIVFGLVAVLAGVVSLPKTSSGNHSALQPVQIPCSRVQVPCSFAKIPCSVERF
jgi:hypothetical protein